MVESIGICEKHLLPLDESGECELCRLSDMPSSAPRARSAWWALVIPVAILGLLAMAAYFAVLSDDESPATQGVPPIAPVAAPEPPAPEPPAAPQERQEPPPERAPRATSPRNLYQIPTHADIEP